VPIVLHPDQKGEVKMNGSGGVKDPTVIVLVNASGDLTQFTICRPIGRVPDTDDKSWVKIPSDHIPSYVLEAGIESQISKHSEKIIANARNDFFVAQNLYKRSGDEFMWGEQTASAVWREAGSSRTHADKIAKELYYRTEAEQGKFLPGTTQNPGKGVPSKTCKPYASKIEDIAAFLPHDKKAAYKSVHDAWKASAEKKAAEKAKIDHLMTEPTLGGPNGITPQTVLPWLRGVPPGLVKTYLGRFLEDPDGVTQEIAAKFHASDVPGAKPAETPKAKKGTPKGAPN